MATLTLIWPRYCYPFVWISLVLIRRTNQPVGLGARICPDLQRGDWRPVIALLSRRARLRFFLGNVELQILAPKWVYHTPGAQFLHRL